MSLLVSPIGPNGTLAKRDARVIANNQKLRFFPSDIVSGRGTQVVDECGRHYLDMSASWGANSVGHAHRDVISAVTSAAKEGSSSSTLSAISPRAVALAEGLLSRMPHEDENERRVLLGHAGTDANNSALAAVRAATGRERVIAFEGGYHGGFGFSKSVSGLFVGAGEPAAPHSALLQYPSVEDDPARDAASVKKLLTDLDEALTAEPTAAIIVESHQSDGGVIVPPSGFLRGVAEAARRVGALLICDEVKIGLGRTGRFHGFDHEGVVPDLVTFGKALGGGLPLSAVVGPAEILDCAPASALLTTAGNAISSAAGLAVLETIDAEALVDSAASMGTLLRALLKEAQSSEQTASAISDVRGRGLSLGIEICDPAAPTDQWLAANMARRTVYRMWQLGVICYLVRDNVIEWTPPLVLSSNNALQAVETLVRALAEVLAGAVTEAEIAPFQGW